MNDLRYALRQLRRSPGFALTAVLTLALGIGATVTMFSIVQQVLLAPLPYAQPERLVGISFAFPGEKPSPEQAGASADFVAAHSRSFASFGIADDGTSAVNLSTGSGGNGTAHAREVQQLRVSAGFLPTLGVQPRLGRLFTAQEDLPAGPRAVVLSHELWTTDFAADPSILGRSIRIDGESVPVVGVLAPHSGADLTGGNATTPAASLWQPLKLSTKDPGYEGDNYSLIARLREGVSTAQADAEVHTFEPAFYTQFPVFRTWTAGGNLLHQFHVWPLKEAITGNIRSSLLLLLGAVSAVLLIACLNLAGLLIARTTGRTRELALRSALGAPRAALLRLLLSETLILAFTGGALGLLLAREGSGLFFATAPLDVPHLQSGSGWGLYALAALGLSVAVALLSGLLPASMALRRGVRTGMQESGTQQGSSRAVLRSGGVLITCQVAFALLLLSGASLLLNSFLRLRATASGVQTAHVLNAQVTLKGARYETAEHTAQFADRVLEQIAHLPGVSRAAAVNGLPLEHGVNMGADLPDQPNLRAYIELRPATAEHFRTIGIPLLTGRTLTSSDSAHSTPVTVINETAAKKWWPSGSALGHTVKVGNEQNFQVVGIVADTHTHSLAEPPQATVYVPVAQMDDGLTKIINGWSPLTFVLKLSGDYDLTAPITAAIHNADPDIPLSRLATMQAVIERTTAAPRFFSTLSTGFAAFALGITAIGLFGLLSYLVTQRTREIGVRMALGANRGDVLRLVVRRGLVLTAIGIAAGGAASAMLPRLLNHIAEDFLYTGNGPVHTVLLQQGIAIGAAVATMLLIALIASLLPAARAATINPTEALRSE